MSNHSALSTPTSRRTVVKGVAWAVPAVTLATRIPAFAASGLCTFTTPAYTSSNTSGGKQVSSLTATNGTSTVTISVATSGTNITYTPSIPSGSANYNMTLGQNVWAGNYRCTWGAASLNPIQDSYGLILNQAASYTATACSTGHWIKNGASSSTPATPSQTLTFTFTDAQGKTINPTNVSIAVEDITAVTTNSNALGNYYDAVYFSSAAGSSMPAQISYPSGSASSSNKLTGSGTSADPYRRSDPANAASDQYANNKQYWHDVFTFSSFPSGSHMTYTDYGYGGWQYIAITGITFSAPC